jgi:hypothetical protein
MPKGVLIVPWSDSEGKLHAAGEEVDLTDDEYQDLRMDGKVHNVDQPYAGQEGHYGDSTTRSDVQGTQPAPTAPEPLNAPEKDTPDDAQARGSRKR